MDDFLRFQNLLMPLIWLISSLVAALILYWTSKALLDVDQLFGVPVKKLRLGGSVVIFLTVFFVLWKSTNYDMIGVSSAQLERVQAAADALENTLPILEACHESRMSDAPQCQVAYEQHKNKVGDLQAALSKLPFTKPAE